MTVEQRIHNYIWQRKSEIVDILKALIKIPSVKGEAKENAPFGAACAEALRYVQALYIKNGFETELDEDGGYLLSYYGSGEKSLGLFAHADVVPVRDDWMLSSPFDPIERDGFIIGRGALDDKSAIVISLYCAKILKELRIPFHARLTTFTGSNEESGMADIKDYVSRHTPPIFSLVCDSGFPLYRGDKGILQFVATQKEPMENVTDFHGGKAFNITLGEATAKVGNLVFSEKGVSRHGALPEGSVNAGYLLAKKLAECDILCKNDKAKMHLISDILEKYYGEIYGIEHDDKDFGRLTVTNGIIQTENKRIRLSFDMRYGASADIRAIKTKIQDFFEGNGWTVTFVRESQPFIIPEDDSFVKACLDAYTCFTKNSEAKPCINAGGTYARFLPRAVETGTYIMGDPLPFSIPDGHGSVHQPDECISISGLLNAIELTALMLLKSDEIVGENI